MQSQRRHLPISREAPWWLRMVVALLEFGTGTIIQLETREDGSTSPTPNLSVTHRLKKEALESTYIFLCIFSWL